VPTDHPSQIAVPAILRRVILVVLLLGVSAIVHAGEIGVSPSSLNFASQTIGTASTPRNVQVINNGHSQIRLTSIATSLSQFASFVPVIPMTLKPGQMLTVVVIFRPSTAQTYRGKLIFTFNTGLTVSTYLDGTGAQRPHVTAPPSISTQPASRTVTAGQTATFFVAATGDGPLRYQWYKNATAIAGATSFSYTTPITKTFDSGALFSATIRNSAGNVTSARAILTVHSVPTHLLTASPSRLAFGSVKVGVNSSLQTTLSNSGNASITISNVSISGPGFGATGLFTGQVLAPGQSASLKVSFTPAANASVTGSVSITTNAANSPMAISLSGTGVPALSHEVTLSWVASTSPAIGYNVYRATASGGPFIRLTSIPIAATSHIDSSVQSGRTYYYRVTSVNSNHVESGYSNESSAVIP
jgi:hypothetical protein